METVKEVIKGKYGKSLTKVATSILSILLDTRILYMK